MEFYLFPLLKLLSLVSSITQNCIIAITSITSTGSVSSVNYNAGQINGIAFTYDSTNKVMSASISIQGDTAPTLGGNLVLNGNNITGTGTGVYYRYVYSMQRLSMATLKNLLLFYVAIV